MKVPFTDTGSIGLPMWAFGSDDPVRVLLIDDDEDEARLTRSLLARVSDVRYKLDWVPTFSEGLTSIARDEHDAFLIDHQLGGRTGVELVREARETGSLAALIMLTGQRDRATDVAAMDAGATDFLMKGRTDAALLDRTLRYAISQAAMVTALERSRDQMSALEKIGRILVDEGPTPLAVQRVVDLIVERFSLARVAIYLADGDVLNLAGHRGYEHPLQTVSRTDSSVERVSRARQPIFVPSLSPEAGYGLLGNAVATELSVPLLVSEEFVGLLNVASFVAAPIGSEDYSAIRVVADRLAAALAVTHERKIAEDRLSQARYELNGTDRRSGPDSLVDPQTLAYRRAMLEPLLKIAIATAGPTRATKFGMLFVACDASEPDAIPRLAAVAREACADRVLVRFSDTEFAVLVAAPAAIARAEGRDFITRAGHAGLTVWCGYAAVAPESDAAELIAATRATLAYARRMGPGTFSG
jgi:DNA-binding response OmpR family regulator